MKNTPRNFSMQAYWDALARDWTPRLKFRGRTPAAWRAWRKKALPRYLELLGAFPRRAPLNAEVESSAADGDLIRERVVFDSEKGMSVPCQLLRPKAMKANRGNPAIICCHGHGPFGKDAVAGIRSSAALEENIRGHNYNYGEQMARAGFLTLCPDLRGFGERADGGNPFPGRDPCNINFIKGALLGRYPLTLNIWDIKCCVDYLETRPEVDKKRIGMMGLSQGGTMTTFAVAAEPRIKAADIMGYVNPWRGFGLRRAQFCGSQIVPEIYADFDTDDIAGLIAPRPLLLEMGLYDDCFYIQDLLKGYAGVRRIYRAAGAGDRLWKDVFPGPHAFSGRKAFDFFRRFL